MAAELLFGDRILEQTEASCPSPSFRWKSGIGSIPKIKSAPGEHLAAEAKGASFHDKPSSVANRRGTGDPAAACLIKSIWSG